MHPQNEKPAILLVAGFGDGPSMFDPLLNTSLAAHYRLVPVALPGFCGEPALPETHLSSLAAYVKELAVREEAHIAVGHSIASPIVCFAALQHPWPINTVLSLEGNLTRADGYFTGTAADYDDPEHFLEHFLARLDAMAADDPILRRYREMVATADPRALWQLGRDSAAYAAQRVPGALLAAVPNPWYFYNPANCASDSVQWLKDHLLPNTILEGASHWPSLDQPGRLAEAMAAALTKIGQPTRS